MCASDSEADTANGDQQVDEVTIVVSADELAFLCNAINETLEAVEEWEYLLRLGATRDQALNLHSQMSALLEAIEPSSARSDQR